MNMPEVEHSCESCELATELADERTENDRLRLALAEIADSPMSGVAAYRMRAVARQAKYSGYTPNSQVRTAKVPIVRPDGHLCWCADPSHSDERGTP